jgi:fucose 4-O-acetylase-like acetyltransferase
MRWSALVDEVVTRTPADRDRVVDLLRVASILVVVAGHWLLAVVTLEDGRIVGDNLLAIVPATQWLTWGLQVMPVFFFVGGRVNGVGWAAAQARGSSAAAWIRRRADRLLRPVLVLVLVWTVLMPVLAELGVGPGLLRLGSQIVLTPAWFLAVYLGIVALVPLTHAAHRRWPLATVVVFVVAAIVVDTAHRAGVPAVGWANYVFVWGGVHQLGYLWGDRRVVTTPRAGLALAAACLAGLLLVTEVLGYPRSMVGVPGALQTNNTPPTVALLLLAGLQVGGVVAAYAPLARWLARPTAWTAVTLLGRRALTVFLWHQTALVAVVGATFPTGLWPAHDTGRRRLVVDAPPVVPDARRGPGGPRRRLRPRRERPPDPGAASRPLDPVAGGRRGRRHGHRPVVARPRGPVRPRQPARRPRGPAGDRRVRRVRARPPRWPPARQAGSDRSAGSRPSGRGPWEDGRGTPRVAARPDPRRSGRRGGQPASSDRRMPCRVTCWRTPVVGSTTPARTRTCPRR